MRKAGINISYFLLLVTLTAHAQNEDIVKKYINTYKDLAIQEMQRSGVPASITLAQGIQESAAGTGELVLKSNNHFGIKCKTEWTGESVRHDDDFRKECFRKYPAAEDSYKDHSDFLRNGQRYAFLFSLNPADYQGWAYGLKKAGYATNPKYAQVLVKLIEDYHLQDYTLIALGKMPHDGDTPEIRSDHTQTETASVISTANAELVNTEQKIAGRTEYPDGAFKINETKVVYIKKGTPFLAIAEKYDIDLFRIFEFNEISATEEASKDQLVYLQRKRKTGNNKFHIVLPGESIHDIAQLEAIRMESLRELNGLKEDMQPAVGEQLYLQTKSASIPKLAVRENYSVNPVTKNQHTN